MPWKARQRRSLERLVPKVPGYDRVQLEIICTTLGKIQALAWSRDRKLFFTFAAYLCPTKCYP